MKLLLKTLGYTREYRNSNNWWLADDEFINHDQDVEPRITTKEDAGILTWITVFINLNLNLSNRFRNCYAWTAVASLEGAIWKATGERHRLSVQQATDCTSVDGYENSHCKCGNVTEGV